MGFIVIPLSKRHLSGFVLPFPGGGVLIESTRQISNCPD